MLEPYAAACAPEEVEEMQESLATDGANSIGILLIVLCEADRLRRIPRDGDAGSGRLSREVPATSDEDPEV